MVGSMSNLDLLAPYNSFTTIWWTISALVLSNLSWPSFTLNVFCPPGELIAVLISPPKDSIHSSIHYFIIIFNFPSSISSKFIPTNLCCLPLFTAIFPKSSSKGLYGLCYHFGINVTDLCIANIPIYSTLTSIHLFIYHTWIISIQCKTILW